MTLFCEATSAFVPRLPRKSVQRHCQRRFTALLYLLPVTVALAAVSACGFTEAKEDAETLAATYFQAAQIKDLDKIVDLYWPSFFQATSREDWGKTMLMVWDKLGVPGDFELQSWRVDAGATAGGTQIVLVYSVTYEDYAAVETLTIFRRSGEAKILGHDINSEGFLR